MRVIPESDDAPEFVYMVEQALNGVIRRYSPSKVSLIKIDNWFGYRWFGFTGKALGRAGVHLNADKGARSIRIPPFVPERIVFERRFAGPNYDEMAMDRPIHKHISSSRALRRMAALESPGEAMIWYSGQSETNGRASLMCYLPVDSSYWDWFLEFEQGEPWRITKNLGIKREDFRLLVNQQDVVTRQDPRPSPV